MSASSEAESGRITICKSDSVDYERAGVCALHTPDDEESYEPANIGYINLVEDGDLVMVLTNFRCTALHGFVCNVLNRFAPIGGPRFRLDTFPDEIHVRVIEAMLKIAGEGFRIMFNPIGTREIMESGLLVYRDDDDPGEAMIALLLTIFCQQRFNVQCLSQAELSDVCVLVDKYGLHDAVEHALNGWLASNGNRHWDYDENSKDVEAGLCIADVLSDHNLFEGALRAQLRHGVGPLVMVDKPFPDKLIGMINDERQGLRDMFTTELSDLLDKYVFSNTPYCDQSQSHCDLASYGSLVKALRRSHVFEVNSELSCHVSLANGRSMNEGVQAIRSFPITTGCRKYERCIRDIYEPTEMLLDLERLVQRIEDSKYEVAVTTILKLWCSVEQGCRNILEE